ncbi:deoxycytidylate deaminase [Nocardia rhizosphaerihabitans]|uniref:deoxycytidylate deaminase n=1 Tax=Nocardia rhizosphaerihabitans TaxID=1691570 RepID=UPI00367264AD
MSRPSWDEYYLDGARWAASRSDCERDRVGAILVKDGRVRGAAYNGAPPKKPGCITCPRRASNVEPGSDYNSGPGRCVALHAEQNILIHYDRDDLIGGTLYVTRKPCPECAKLLGGSGLERIVHP